MASEPADLPSGLPAAKAVLVVGGANMDVGARTDRALLAGDSTPGFIHHAPGGVGRNIAENLARLGIAVQLATLVGDDAFGAQLLTATAAAGVDMALTQRVAGLRTATYLSLHGPDGDMALAVNDMAILDQLTPTWCAANLPAPTASGVQLLDCNLPPDTLAYLLARDVVSVVDAVSVAKCERLRPWLPRVALLKCNRLEAQAMTQHPTDTVAQALEAAQALVRLGAQRSVITLGADGVCWCDQDGQAGFRPAREVPVVSTTGAGDALLAGVVAAWQRGQPLAQAVAYGMACAEITLSSTFANAADLSPAAVLKHL
ncbi:MAG: carbohydrate kinase family protein [Rhodoferax sp.]|nr:carbohydrate kinase family protein [Rhodoferax sp.]